MPSTFHFLRKTLLCGVLSLFNPLAAVSDIHVPDPALQKAIAYSIGVNERDLTVALIQEKLEFLEANDRGIRDLSGLEHALSLKTLVIRDNLIEDFRPLSNLKSLIKLDISGNRLSNLDTLVPLAGKDVESRVSELKLKLNDSELEGNDRTQMTLELSELSRKLKGGRRIIRELNLARNRLLGLRGINHFTSLVHLDVSENALLDLEGVGQLKNLVNLFAQNNQLGRPESYTDANRNKKFDPGEKFRDISGNNKRDSDPLKEIQNLKKLSNLHLYNNRISKIDSLGNLPQLNTLLLSGNKIEEISGLGEFDSLRQLALANNRIYSLDGLQNLYNLLHLNLSENQICDLRPVRSLNALRSIDLHSNLLIDLSDLSSLNNLQIAGLSRNMIVDPSPIYKLPNIKQIYLGYNFLPLELQEYQETEALVLAKKVRLQTANQIPFIAEAQNLVKCLLGFDQSNKRFGDYLRKNGYLRLTDFMENSNYQDQQKINLLKKWREVIVKGSSLDSVSLP